MSDKNMLFKSLLFGFISSLFASVIMICIVAVIIMSIGLLSTELMDYIMLGVLSVSCLFGGFVSAKINKTQGLICGAVTGFIVFVITTIAGLATFSETVTLLTLFKFIFTLLCGSVGGILGVNQKEKISIK